MTSCDCHVIYVASTAADLNQFVAECLSDKREPVDIGARLQEHSHVRHTHTHTHTQ